MGMIYMSLGLNGVMEEEVEFRVHFPQEQQKFLTMAGIKMELL